MTIQRRTAFVNALVVNTEAFGSVIQVGDNEQTVLRSRTFALQRAIPDFLGDEVRFASYPIFFRPEAELAAEPSVLFESRSPVPEIRVGSVTAASVVASSLIRLGSSFSVAAHSRIKHIRQFNDGTAGTTYGRPG